MISEGYDIKVLGEPPVQTDSIQCTPESRPPSSRAATEQELEGIVPLLFALVADKGPVMVTSSLAIS